MGGKLARESRAAGTVTSPATASHMSPNVAMLHLLIDENFDQRILRGLELRMSSLDAVIVQDTALQGLPDPPFMVTS